MSEARDIAEDQLEVALKDVLADELEACWSRLKDDPAITDPEEEMAELAEWFGEQVQALIDEIIADDPDEDDDAFEDDEEDDDDDDEADTEDE